MNHPFFDKIEWEDLHIRTSSFCSDLRISINALVTFQKIVQTTYICHSSYTPVLKLQMPPLWQTSRILSCRPPRTRKDSPFPPSFSPPSRAPRVFLASTRHLVPTGLFYVSKRPPTLSAFPGAPPSTRFASLRHLPVRSRPQSPPVTLMSLRVHTKMQLTIGRCSRRRRFAWSLLPHATRSRRPFGPPSKHRTTGCPLSRARARCAAPRLGARCQTERRCGSSWTA